MTRYSETIENLIQKLGALPGIGARTAERLAFHLLNSSSDEAMALAEAIRDVKTKIRPCARCFNLAEDELCNICADAARDATIVCVVEHPKDVLALEATGAFGGVYHVLQGALAPLDGVEPEDLTVEPLVQRVGGGAVRELILATNPTVAGDATALHIQQRLTGMDVKITRLARGLPAGGQIEYANRTILSDALTDRRDVT